MKHMFGETNRDRIMAYMKWKTTQGYRVTPLKITINLVGIIETCWVVIVQFKKYIFLSIWSGGFHKMFLLLYYLFKISAQEWWARPVTSNTFCFVVVGPWAWLRCPKIIPEILHLTIVLCFTMRNAKRMTCTGTHPTDAQPCRMQCGWKASWKDLIFV